MAGEAKKKGQHRMRILANEARCIYCAEPPTTVEHMPPICMFEKRFRLKGMEFACCEECNTGTKAADLIAACMALVTPFETQGDWRTPQFSKYIQSAEKLVPGIKAEFLRPGKFALNSP